MVGTVKSTKIKMWVTVIALVGAGIFLLVISNRSIQAVEITPDNPVDLTECI